jgi:hypothetical protein
MSVADLVGDVGPEVGAQAERLHIDPLVVAVEKAIMQTLRVISGLVAGCSRESL